MSTLLLLGEEAKLLYRHQGLKQGIHLHFQKGEDEIMTGVRMSVVLLTDSIAEIDQERREVIRDQLIAWAKSENPYAIRSRLNGLDQDSLVTRVQWAILAVSDLAKDTSIPEEEFELFRSEVWGALDGRSPSERSAFRAKKLLHDLFSSSN